VLDEAALTALSNKGLVRRARKDLETLAPRIVGESGEFLQVGIEEWTVEVSLRPAESRCGCPASGVCRHILAALIHLGTPTEPAGSEVQPPPVCGEELLAITDEDLRRWAGSAGVKRALIEVAAGLVVECTDGAPWVAREPRWNVECRWLPGGGLAGMLCSCHADGACVHKVAAVLAWQAQRGRRDIAREETALAESAGAPRTRDEVRTSVSETLAEMVGLGLSRVAPTTEARIKTLATSAHGVDLPRLERLLRGLADEVGAWLRRDAQASSEAILTRAAVVAALNTALEHPKPSLVGRHRSRYDRVGELDLVGMGARAWRTRSGYAGLTVYLWDLRGGRWNTWTESRPVTTPGFSPVARFSAPGPWAGCESPAHAAAHCFRLAAAWRNPQGRLSGRESSTMVLVGARMDALDGHVIRSWALLAPKAWELFSVGLTESEEMGHLVLLQPKAWGRCAYDEVFQEIRAEVVDEAGRSLVLALSNTDENRKAIDALEAATHSAPPRILGSLHLRRGVLAVEPISLIREENVQSLGLDGQAASSAMSTAEAPEEVDALDGDESDEVEPSYGDGAVGAHLSSLQAELESLAELGSAAYRGWPRLRALMQRSDDLGMAVVGTRVRSLLEAGQLAEAAHSHAVAWECLRATYVVRLTAATAAVESATQAYGR
jgi:hypothetical protein